MSTTQPIKTLAQVESLKNFYYMKKPNLRNYCLISLGINSALRISDLLQLKWKDVYDFQCCRFFQHLTVIEKKTKKRTQIALNKSATQALYVYMSSLSTPLFDAYLFPGQKETAPLSRSQAFRIIKKAGEQLQFEKQISCHSLRKTFGYHAWKSGIPPVILMEIYNHSSYQITKRYLGIDQDDKDSVFLKINL